MKLKDLFTVEELSMIDSGEYRPGRAVLDAKLDLCAAIEREACAYVAEQGFKFSKDGYQIADDIRARGNALA